MKRNLTIALLICATLGLFAQENGNRDANGKVVRGPYETNKFFDNWFIELGAGGSTYLGGQYEGAIGDRISPTFNLSVGKWITPAIGVRLQGNYHLNMSEFSAVNRTVHTLSGSNKQQFNLFNVHADYMWNMFNTFAGYKATRVYQLIPYGGFGFGNLTSKQGGNNYELMVNFGLLNKFRITRTLDINLELASAIVKGDFDRSPSALLLKRIDAPVSASIGLTFNLGKVKTFKRVVKEDVSALHERIKSLENDNSTLSNDNKNLVGEQTKLAKTNKELAEENEALRKRKPQTETVANLNTPGVALFFEIGQATLGKKDLANLELYAETIKANPGKTFTIVGSADTATGSARRNQQLSEQRAQYVYNLLVNKYGIPADRLVKRAAGDQNNRFSDPSLNRVVIFE